MLPLALARVVLILVVVLVLIAPFGYLSICGYDPGPDKLVPAPLSCLRRALFLPVRLGSRAVLFCMGFHWVCIRGTKAPSTEAPILVPNHLVCPNNRCYRERLAVAG